MNPTFESAIPAAILALAVAASAAAPAAKAEPVYLSPVALAADKAGRTLYVAEATADQVAVLDLAAGKVTRTLRLPGAPGGLALSGDGQLFVTIDEADGLLVILDAATGRQKGSVRVGHSPTAPALSPDGRTLYLCNRFDNSVSVVDTQEAKELTRIPVLRQPVASAPTPDGKQLVVTNHLPIGRSDKSKIAAAVSVIDTAGRKVAATISLPNGSTGVRGACVSPDGRYAAVTHLLGRYALPTTQLERGWMNTNALTLIDLREAKWVNTVLLDDVDLGAANPWGVAYAQDGKKICIAHAGAHELSVIGAPALLAKLAQAAADKKADEVRNDLTFLVGLRRRIRLRGKGPRALAVAAGKAYVAEYFSDSLSVVDLAGSAPPRVRSIALGPPAKPNPVRRGEMLFHDANMCFQKWQSCASCHPDGRADGLNWDLLSDGIGSPRKTKSLLLAHQTPPAMVTGARKSAEEAVRAGIRHVQFAVRPEADAAAVDAYLKSLKPVPSPYLAGGKLSEAARRGRKLFAAADCARCHPAPLYTDKKAYDIGLGTGPDKGRKFDTTALVEAWRAAPYLYDGRAETMMDVLKKHNPADKHGKTSKLTEKKLGDLAQFILSL